MNSLTSQRHRDFDIKKKKSQSQSHDGPILQLLWESGKRKPRLWPLKLPGNFTLLARLRLLQQRGERRTSPKSETGRRWSEQLSMRSWPQPPER